MKIIVVLPPENQRFESSAQSYDSENGFTLSELATKTFREVHEEALSLKQSDSCHEVVLAVMGQQRNPVEMDRLIALGYDRGVHIASDLIPSAMEIAETLVDLIWDECPDLILIGRESCQQSNSQVGRMLAELLEFRRSAKSSEESNLQRLLVIREIGSGQHTVELPLISFNNAGSQNEMIAAMRADNITGHRSGYVMASGAAE